MYVVLKCFYSMFVSTILNLNKFLFTRVGAVVDYLKLPFQIIYMLSKGLPKVCKAHPRACFLMRLLLGI